MSKSNVSDKNLGDSDNNKFRDQKKKAFVKKQYHGAFGGTTTTKFEGRIEVLKAAVYDFIGLRQPELYIRTTREIADYVGRTLKYYGSDAKTAIENLELPVIPRPGTKPILGVDDADELDLKIWEKEIDEYMAQRKWLKQNMKTAYIIVWGQCSDAMRARAEATTDFKKTSKEQDTIELLKVIKQIMFCNDTVKFSPHALRNAHRRFNTFEQSRTATPNEYLDSFMNCVDVIIYSGGEIGLDPEMIKLAEADIGVKYSEGTDDQKTKIHAAAKERYLATCFFLGADKHRYGRLIENTENNFIQNVNQYPKTISAAHSLLLNYKQDPRNLIKMVGGFSDGIAFATSTTEKNKKNNKNHITCHRCGKKGHYANETDVCQGQTKPESSAVAAVTTNNYEDGSEEEEDVNRNFEFCGCHQEAINCKLGEDGKVPSSWILLDNQSTIDVFYNKALLTNIRKVPTKMNIHCNAGISTTNMVGDLAGYGTVWYHKNGIANILSLAKVSREHSVKFDSANGNKFEVKKKDGKGKTMTFKQSSNGLYFFDINENNRGIAMVTTVEKKMEKYTKKSIEQAKLARKIQQAIGYPSTTEFIKNIKGVT